MPTVSSSEARRRILPTWVSVDHLYAWTSVAGSLHARRCPLRRYVRSGVLWRARPRVVRRRTEPRLGLTKALEVGRSVRPEGEPPLMSCPRKLPQELIDRGTRTGSSPGVRLLTLAFRECLIIRRAVAFQG